MTGRRKVGPMELMRSQLTEREYLESLERAAQIFPWGAKNIVENLRSPKGIAKSIKALAELKATPQDAEGILFSTIKAANMGMGAPAIRKYSDDKVQRYRREASALGDLERRLDPDHPIVLTVGHRRALADIQQYLIEQADTFEDQLSELPITGKAAPKRPRTPKAEVSKLRSAAAVMERTALMQLRVERFSVRPPHRPMKLLIEAALGRDVRPQVVKDALRVRSTRNGGKQAKSKLAP